MCLEAPDVQALTTKSAVSATHHWPLTHWPHAIISLVRHSYANRLNITTAISSLRFMSSPQQCE
jgi:hypothetical protein